MTDIIICGAGYYGCPRGDEHHYHCGKCGAISGQQGHYFRDPQSGHHVFQCPENAQRYAQANHLRHTLDIYGSDSG